MYLCDLGLRLTVLYMSALSIKVELGGRVQQKTVHKAYSSRIEVDVRNRSPIR